jgi:hypothetical protein
LTTNEYAIKLVLQINRLESTSGDSTIFSLAAGLVKALLVNRRMT